MYSWKSSRKKNLRKSEQRANKELEDTLLSFKLQKLQIIFVSKIRNLKQNSSMETYLCISFACIYIHVHTICMRIAPGKLYKNIDKKLGYDILL